MNHKTPNFRRSALARSAMLACSAMAAVLAAQTAYAQAASTSLERVEVTGSAIRRTNVEGPAPVEIVTKKEIARSGATSINELLHNIPSIDIFDQGELASNSPAGSGTASIRMRGLSESQVLVLLNGRRLPVNALYDSSGAGAAFDINSLPIGAIERIEILKDGGSAIYGADAVAGVVNFITKNDYQGIEATANLGTSSRSDGNEKRFGLSAGFGDLTKDRYNVLFGLDIFKRDPILRKDRDISSTVDFRAAGGPDRRSGFSPTGNVINPNTGAFVGIPYATCPPENLGAGNICRYDFNKSLLTAYNGADRLSALLIGTVQITPTTKAFAEMTFSTSKDHFEAHPVPDYFVVPITSAAQAPYDIGDGSVYIAGRFMQGGPRTTNRKSRFLNTAVGADGTFGNYDWKVSLNHGVSKVTNSDSNYFNANTWYTATSNGSLNPTVSTNDPALVESLRVYPTREGKSTLSSLNAQLSGDVTQMPAGALKFAVGASANRESLVDTPDPLTQAGEVVGSIQQAPVNASRSFQAVFGELSIPVTKTIEAQAALRYDHYDNANATSPKLGVKWAVLPELAFRGSFTKSFRAPVLKQLYGAQEEGATNITDPESCQKLGVPLDADGECFYAAYQVNGSNPNLQPEKAKTLNFGMVFELAKNFNASIDWWKIQKTNDITSPTLTSAIDAGLFTKVGPKTSIFTNLQNIAERETEGVDIDARWRFRGTAIGDITLRDLFTYYMTNKTRSSATDSWAEYVDTYANPKYRNAFNVTVEKGPWTFGGTIKTVGGFLDTDQPIEANATTKRVTSFTELDFVTQYSGFKNLELTFGIKNLMDRMPPFSLQNASSNSYTQMGFAELYGNRGRFFYVSGKYVFR
ncbi:MAG: TonB-dependent receptor [Rhodoferax sp.]|uniref:TonB-dependent receptor plug domain-containing protein n=1 Tax=Rhodoferax sp. TaxID=50421 RepID=UPI001B6208CD|nr:TonB-dependent receptor [Rhodoferax sp.]MBP9904789.1 TonB-dependent receptor [Rhodoferax sp.]